LYKTLVLHLNNSELLICLLFRALSKVLIKFITSFSEGGFFKAHLHFPKEYPLRPPRMKFVTEIWHPNSKWFNQFTHFLIFINLFCNNTDVRTIRCFYFHCTVLFFTCYIFKYFFMTFYQIFTYIKYKLT
jgi:hypothetical protein